VQQTPTPKQIAAAVELSRPRVPGLGFAVRHERGDGAGPGSAAFDGDLEPGADLVGERLREFRLGRAALRAAMLGAGLAAVPVPRDGRRPRLPADTAASISHSGGVAVALAGPRGSFLSLGVDLETSPLPARSARLFLTEPESAWVRRDGAAAAELRLVCAFSAKEAVYKAIDQLPGLVGQAPPLRALHLAPAEGGFIAWTRERPEQPLRVHVRPIGRGALCWTWISA
jgi:hypothetical protein